MAEYIRRSFTMFDKSFRKRLSVALALTTSLSLTACGTSMPNAGPLAGEIEQAKSVSIVHVTPDMAAQMQTEAHDRQQSEITAALNHLALSQAANDYRLHAGDDLQISLWSFSEGGGGGGLGVDPSQSASSPTMASGIQGTPLGKFQIDASGSVTLPYAGRVVVDGKTESQARSAIMARYKALGILHNPDVTVRVAEGHQGVLVTGATGQPQIVPWNAGGVSLSEAITLGLGNGTTTLNENSSSSSSSDTASTNAITVAVVRNGVETDIPMSAALDQDITLHPKDKVIIRKRPAVQVTMLGGGIVRNGLLSFAKSPSLAATIAASQGLNPNTANSTKIFIFRQHYGQKPTLFTFSWTDGDGLAASQLFPMENNDIVYVAESPIIPVARVLNTIFQMAEPALIARP